MTELEQIVQSVAKALEMEYSSGYYIPLSDWIFSPYMRARCEDYLLTRGDITLHKTGAHWFFEPSIHNRDQIEILCQAGEFFARAIHELLKLDENPEAVE